ncbi:MAG: DNA replication/repair protein RecF [Anaerolineae bacterium]|nr:DNA replication/repair protein RecF [Anaerolineae bacterium]
MHVEHLSLVNFRNYARLELALPTGPILLHGANAQGKTSLLEAIYYLATSNSPYTTADWQLINWRAEHDVIPFTRLSADVVTQTSPLNRIEITLTREPNGLDQRTRKDIRLNGVNRRVMDLVGQVNVVLFLPRDLELIEGSPEVRRRYMNATLCQTDRDYCEALAQYERLLPQRNALLRRIGEGQGSPDELEFWDMQLAEYGAALIAGRQRLLRALEDQAQRTHLDLTGKREVLEIGYQPSFIPTAEGDGQLSFSALGLDLHRELTAAEIGPQFLAALQAQRAEHVERGVTLIGPHRDELRFQINQRDVGLYGSRGQARTAVLSLKLAELLWMRDAIGEWPILLLDEVIAELDAERRAYLLAQIGGATQTILTTTDTGIFTPEFLARAGVWHVAEGQIAVA